MNGTLDTLNGNNITSTQDYSQAGPSSSSSAQMTPTASSNGTAAATAIVCNGCKLGLEETSDSVVVSFGEGLWHVDCRCAKCHSLVEHDTNLLLLADGSPVCENCSYVCSSCGKSISNEAIVTGDESYHADCFRCKSCSTRIEELVFAKTSQGIYCMGCHNERVARTRKHAENKRNKSLRRKDGAGGSSSGRHHSSSSSSSQQHGREPSSSTQRPKIGVGGSSSHASSSNSLDPHTTTSGASTRSPSASSTSAFLDAQDSPAATAATSSPSGSLSSTADLPPLGLKKLREKEKLSLIPEGGTLSRSGAGAEYSRSSSQQQQAESPSRLTFDGSSSSRTGQRSVSDSRTHSRTPSNATLGGNGVDGDRDIRKQRSFDTSAAAQDQQQQQQQQQKLRRAQSPNLSHSQPSQRQQERSASAMDDYTRPSTAGAVGLSISRSASPNSLLGTSPTDRPPLLMDRSPSRSDLSSSGTSPNGGGLATFSPPARSSSADATTAAGGGGGGAGSLALPKASNKNANRRSGFYGVMAIPQVPSPGASAGQSSSLSAGGTSAAHSDTDKDQDDYFLVSKSQQAQAQEDGEADTSSRTVIASSASGSGLDSGDEVNVQPLSINVSRASGVGVSTPQRKQDSQQQRQWDTSSSTLASIDTASSSSGFVQDSTSASASGSSLVSSSAEQQQQPSQQAKSGHLSFYDPDVLVFLDAVNDSTPVSAGSSNNNRRSSKLFQGTPTRPSLDATSSNSTPQAPAPKSAATAAPTGTLASPAASPRLSQFASRHLNLVAEGHLPAGTSPRQREGSPIVSPSGIGDSGDEADDREEDEEEEEVEHLSPLAGSGASRRDSRSNYAYQGGSHGLGLSTGSTGSARNRLHSSDTALTFNNNGEEEEDGFSKDTLRKVRESIRRSRGGSVSRGAAGAGGDAAAAAANGMTLDVELVELLINELEQTKNKMKELQKNYNAIRRASRQAFEGFSMAREEYDREVAARRDAEFEMLRLKDQMKEQAAKLGALDEIEKKKELLQRRSNDLRNSVVGIEKELSKMKAERDMTVAEMEELAGLPKSGNDASVMPERLSVALNTRLTSLRDEYRSDLESLNSQRESLKREIGELQQARDLFTQETETLNDRNTDLATQAVEGARKVEALKAEIATATKSLADLKVQYQQVQAQQGPPASALQQSLQSLKEKALPPPSTNANSRNSPSPALNASTGSTSTGYSSTPMNQSASSASQRNVLPSAPPAATAEEQVAPATFIAHKVDPVASQATVRKFKWGSKKGLERPVNASISKHPMMQPQRSTGPQELSARQHNFMATSILRPVRCEHCGDKMWGIGEQRCQACGIYCHTKCISSFHIICNSASIAEEPPSDPSSTGLTTMFGNDLVAQCLTENRLVPTVVTTCIDAVEATALEYEGIYRKSGGMGQTKLISSCFDRGEPFDLQDEDRFNDISAVTSVLKNYFRNLPNPLYTFEFHQEFCSLPQIAETAARISALEALLHKLPEQHFSTLKTLMLHLHRIHRASKENKMTPANLGVVFGPTLLRSPDPSQEFSQMHLKARVVELSVENAPTLFAEPFRGA